MYEPSTGLTEQYAIEGFKSNSDGLAINANLRNLYNSNLPACLHSIFSCSQQVAFSELMAVSMEYQLAQKRF